jgi:hypothetical protein
VGIIRLGKFEYKIYFTTHKGHRGSLYNIYFRTMWSGYLFSVSKGAFRMLKLKRGPLRVTGEDTRHCATEEKPLRVRV